MNTNKNCTRGGGAHASKKLLAALAVLAVALVALVAVPAADASESDAAGEPAVEVLAAGYIGDAADAKSMLGAIKNGDYSSISSPVLFAVYNIGADSGVTVKVSDAAGTHVWTETFSGVEAGEHVWYSGYGLYESGSKVSVNGNGAPVLNGNEVVVGDENYKDVFEPYSADALYSIEVVTEGGNKTVSAGKDVKLFGDLKITQSVAIAGDLIIDLNGHVLNSVVTGNAVSFGVGYDASLTVTDSAIAKGKLSAMSYTEGTQGVIKAGAEAEIVLNGMVFETNGTALYPQGNASSVTIEDSVIKAGVYAVGTNNQESNGNKIAISITGSTLEATGYQTQDENKFMSDGDAATVMINVGGATLDIEDSVLKGHRQVLFVRAGTATVTDTVIEHDNSYSGGKYDEGNWDTGNDAPNAAVLVGTSNVKTKYGDSELTIEGGSITTTGVAVWTYQNENAANKGNVNLLIGSKSNPTIVTCNKTVDGKVVEKTTASIACMQVDTTDFKLRTGSIEVSGASTVVSGVEVIEGSLVIENGNTLIIADGATLVVEADATLVVEADATLVVEADATLNVGNDASVKLESGATFINNGGVLIASAVDDSEAGSIVAETGATVTGDSPISNITIKTDGELEVAELSGKIKGAEFEATQEVRIVKDTEITSGNLTIAGRLVVPEGVTLTIDANSKLILTGTAVAEIRGTLVMAEEYGKTPAKIEMSDYSKVLVYGTLDANGDVEIGGASVFSIEEGADAVISGTVTGNVTVKDSASLTVAGAIGIVGAPGSFDVAGTLVISSEKVSQEFIVHLSDGAVADMEYVVMAGGQEITVEDDGVVIYDSKNKDPKYTDTFPENGSTSYKNTLTVKPTVDVTGTMPTGAAGGAAISGIKVTTTETSAKITDKSKIGGTDTKFPATGYYSADGTENLYQHYFTMAVSGSMNVAGKVVYDGGADLPTITASADIEFNAASKGTISEDSAVGTDAKLTVKGFVAVDALVTLAYAVDSAAHYGKMVNEAVMTVNGKIDATAAAVTSASKLFTNSGKLILSGAGEVLINNGDSLVVPITTGVDGAAYFTSVKDGTKTVCTFHYVTVDAALAAMNAGTTKAVSLYGSNTLAASASVPADAAVTLQSGSALDVGSSSKGKDVVLTFVSGARLAKASSGEATVTVNGTLYAEKQTDISSAIRGAIKSDVIANETDAKGNPLSSGWAKWTNLTTALDEAEAGQVITISPTAGTGGVVYLKSETTIKEGVVLIVNGKTLTVNNGVSLVIDGTLDLSVAGSGLVVALNYKDAADRSKDKTAANIVLNGTVKTALGETPVYKGYYDGSKVVRVTNDNLTTANGSYRATSDYTNPKYTIAGAYNSDDDYSYIATVENAAAIISAVKDQWITVKADESFTGTLKVGDITVSGDATKNDFAVIEVDGSVPAIEFGSVKLSDAVVEIASNVKISASVSGADGSVELKGKSSGFRIGVLPYGEDVEAVLSVNGKMADYRSYTGAVSTFFKTEGTVYILGESELKVDEIVIGGEASVVKSDSTSTVDVVLGGRTEDYLDSGTNWTVYATEVTVSGVLNIKDGMVVESVKSSEGPYTNAYTCKSVTVDVAGSVVLKDSGSRFVVDVLTVSGTVDASEISETTLKYTTSVTADVLYIGTDSNIESASDVADTVFTASAVVKGAVYLKGAGSYAVVAAGATAPVAWTADDAALDTSIEMKSTVLTVEATVGADAYVTLFAPENSTKHIADFFLATQDSEFDGWMNAKGTIAKRTLNNTGAEYTYTPEEAMIGAEGWTAVTAKIDTQIYAVKIVTDGGIASVTLNGILMTPGSNGLFVAEKLKAGTYTVAFSAASGYDVKDVRMSAADGTAVSGFSFSVSGMDKGSYAEVVAGGEEYYTSSYQLTGSAIAAPSGGSSGGMSHDDAQGIIDAIDKNTDAVKNQPAGGSADNSLTNILLIVLVVLIVIMAALVAMRMMRS